jgi:hypothetical protein
MTGPAGRLPIRESVEGQSPVSSFGATKKRMKPPTCRHTFAKTLRIAFALVGAVLSSEISAKEYSAKTHFYAIEYLKPSVGTGDVSILNVTFNRRLDAQTAERVLREELGRAVVLFPPQGDVLAYSWTQTDPEPGTEQMISFSDRSHFLIYSSKTKQIQTEKEYDISRQQPVQLGKGINIDLSIEIERGADGRVRILGKTNLPHGMTLMLGLRDTGSKYFAQDKVEVVDSRIVSSWFSDGGRPLRSGTYNIEVSSPLPALQPKGVRAIIGQTGENLLGPVRTSMGSKMVEYKVKKSLK